MVSTNKKSSHHRRTEEEKRDIEFGPANGTSSGKVKRVLERKGKQRPKARMVLLLSLMILIFMCNKKKIIHE